MLLMQMLTYMSFVQLKDFALVGWKAEPALPLWQSPTSSIGRAWGQIQG